MREQPPMGANETSSENALEKRTAVKEWIEAIDEEFLRFDARLPALLSHVTGKTSDGRELSVEIEAAIRHMHQRLGKLYSRHLNIPDQVWNDEVSS
ncbi:MAG: hypothetical protein PHC53_03175 [Patescibacteria group bacterium]|nr:hypothetical protein [Patescibacteria group bacterium]